LQTPFAVTESNGTISGCAFNRLTAFSRRRLLSKPYSQVLVPVFDFWFYTAGKRNDRNSMNCPDCGNPVEKEAQCCPKCSTRMEPPAFWRKLLRFIRGTGEPRQTIINIKKTDSINTTDEDGQHHEYHSLGH